MDVGLYVIGACLSFYCIHHFMFVNGKNLQLPLKLLKV